MSKKRRCFAST